MSREAMKLALEALERTLEMLEQADCSTGYCCCGSLIDGHGIGDGHGPVDGGDYYQSKAIQAARHAITALREALAEQPAPVASPHEQEPVAGKGRELSEQLKLCARNVAFVAAGRVDMSSAAMQEMFTLIDHVCAGIDSPQPAQQQEPDDLTIAYMAGFSRGKDLAAQRTWVGLTPEELDEMFSKTLKGKKLVNWVAKAIEAKLKEKNT